MIIDGFKIHPELLQEAPAERCVLSECLGACCTGGAWLDVTQLKLIVPQVAALQANLPEDRRDPNLWFSAPADDEDSPAGATVGTMVVDDVRRPGQTCCVFLRPDRWCALQVTSQQLGLAYPGLKPLFCALYPLQIRDGEIVIDHETMQLFAGATCRRARATVADARPQPLYRVFKEELLLILGEDGYRALADAATSSAESAAT